MRPVKLSLNRYQVSQWLASRTPDEEVFLKHGAKWAEDLFAFYKIPKREH
jgi:hypothetical protein